MKRATSVLVSLVLVSMVPVLAMAELSVPESCCAMPDASMVSVSCCAMESCSMSSREETSYPHHDATKAETKTPQQETPSADVDPMSAPSTPDVLIVRDIEGADSSPPTTSERLAIISTYLI